MADDTKFHSVLRLFKFYWIVGNNNGFNLDEMVTNAIESKRIAKAAMLSKPQHEKIKSLDFLMFTSGMWKTNMECLIRNKSTVGNIPLTIIEDNKNIVVSH